MQGGGAIGLGHIHVSFLSKQPGHSAAVLVHNSVGDIATESCGQQRRKNQHHRNCANSKVGRSPWTAADAPVGLRVGCGEAAGPGGPARTRASAPLRRQYLWWKYW